MLKHILISSLLFFSTELKAEAGRMNLCKSDAEKFCKGIEPGGGRIIKCLKEHLKDLSDACKPMVGMADQMAEKMAQAGMGGQGGMPEACKADAEQFCKDAGDGKRRECMKNNFSKFSAPCKSALEVKRAERMKGMESSKQMQPNNNPPPAKK